jgi:hypothetical protein
VSGNELIVSFTPALENARTYRINIDASVSSIAGQFVEVRGLVGDVDNNGQVNGSDRGAVSGVVSAGGFSCSTDLNGNGATNAADRGVAVGAATGVQNCAP